MTLKGNSTSERKQVNATQLLKIRQWLMSIIPVIRRQRLGES
jgi:hypothetical protein